MWIDRKFEGIVAREAAARPGLVLTGGRQVGTSSLLARVFPGHHAVSLDLPSEAHDAEHEPTSFLARHPLPLIVDEVQLRGGREIEGVAPDPDQVRRGTMETAPPET